MKTETVELNSRPERRRHLKWAIFWTVFAVFWVGSALADLHHVRAREFDITAATVICAAVQWFYWWWGERNRRVLAFQIPVGLASLIFVRFVVQGCLAAGYDIRTLVAFGMSVLGICLVSVVATRIAGRR